MGHLTSRGDFCSEKEELRAREWFMESRGYRFCDIPACNCNSWHQGHCEARLRDIRDLLQDYDVPTNGIILLDVIEAAVIKAGYTTD